MKFSIKNITVAALALMTTACSSDINELIQNEEQPAYSNGVITVTGQLAPKKALTRALSEGKDAENKNIIVADWKVGETLAVSYYSDEAKREMGKATITEVDPSTGAANFVFNLENGTQIHQHPECTIIYPYKAALDDATGVKDYAEFLDTQDGTLSPNLDVRVGEGIISDVVGHLGSATATLTVTKQPEVKNSIFKFNLSNGSIPIQSSVFFVKENGKLITTAITTSLYEVYVALPPSSAGTQYEFTAIEGGGTVYTKELTSKKAINKGEYYETTLTMTGGTNQKVELSAQTSEYKAQNYDVLTGTLGKNVKISIAAGATVILFGANINANGTWTTGDYAGLTCEGNATVILTGGTSRTNTIKGFYNSYPGIYVPAGKTLTILGTNNDYLTVSSNGYGAGIGAGNAIGCGNIVIKGGKITATGGTNAAGIGGGGSGNCGNIIITGGIIESTGGMGAVGIGSGSNASCGAITFTNTVSRLKSVAGTSANYTVGASVGGTCGKITIGGTEREQSSFAVGSGDASTEFNYLP